MKTIKTILGILCLAAPLLAGEAEINYLPYKELQGKLQHRELEPGLYYAAPIANPNIELATGEENGTQFIEIQGANDNRIPFSRAKFVRVVSIPPNAPKTIQISFMAKFVEEPLSGWEKMPGKKVKEPKNINISFSSPEEKGGDEMIELEPNVGWKKIEKTITIPDNANLLLLNINAIKGQKVAFANWEIH